MAITANAPTFASRPFGGNKWVISAYSADLSGCESLKAAVAGKSHYVTKLKIQCASAITITFGEGETTGAVTTIWLGPIPFSASGPAFEIDFGELSIQGTANTAITVDASGAGAAAVYMEGYTV
jgi:hypothetical protein